MQNMVQYLLVPCRKLVSEDSAFPALILVLVLPFLNLNAESNSTMALGFLAVGYEDGQLFVVNMRGPAVIYRDEPVARKRRSVINDPVRTLCWTMCSMGSGTYISRFA